MGVGSGATQVSNAALDHFLHKTEVNTEIVLGLELADDPCPRCGKWVSKWAKIVQCEMAASQHFVSCGVQAHWAEVAPWCVIAVPCVDLAITVSASGLLVMASPF